MEAEVGVGEGVTDRGRNWRAPGHRVAARRVHDLGAGRCSAVREPLDHGDLVAGRVECDLVHERADQEQAPAADPEEVLGLDRAVELRRVEARAIVGDRERGGLRGRSGPARGSAGTRKGSGAASASASS